MVIMGKLSDSTIVLTIIIVFLAIQWIATR
jgi:hypothetical protein